MMNKKGLSHIEFVVSFIVFIGFIVFAFAFFNPLSSQRTLKSTMDYAWIEISQHGREEAETYSISISNSFVQPLMNIFVDGVPLEYFAKAEDFYGNPLPTFRDTNGIVFLDRGINQFIRITYSKSIQNGLPISGTTPIGNTQYVISSSEVKELYSEKLFLDLNQSYYSDYSALKQELNLPNRMDFGFVITFQDSQINAINQIPEGVEVLSKNDRIEIIRSSGKREYAEVRVLVW